MRIFKSNSRGSVSQHKGAAPEAESADVLAGDHIDSESSEAYQAAFLDYMDTLIMGETDTQATKDSTVLVSGIKTDPASPRHHSEQPERLFTIRTQPPPDSPIASTLSPLPSPSPLAVLKPKKFGLIRTCAKAASKLTIRRNKQIAPQPLGQPLGEGVESHVLDNDSIINTRETDSSVNTQALYLKEDIFASRDGAEGSDTDPSGSSGANRGPGLANGTLSLDKREEDLDRQYINSASKAQATIQQTLNKMNKRHSGYFGKKSPSYSPTTPYSPQTLPDLSRSRSPSYAPLNSAAYPGYRTYAASPQLTQNSARSPSRVDGTASFSYTLSTEGGVQSVGMLRVYVQQLYNENLQLRSHLGLGPASGGIEKLLKMESSLETMLKGYRQAQQREAEADEQCRQMSDQVTVMQAELRQRQESSNTKSAEALLLRQRLEETSQLLDVSRTQAQELRVVYAHMKERLQQREDEVLMLESALKAAKAGNQGGEQYAIYHATQENKRLLNRVHDLQLRLRDIEQGQLQREQYILQLETECTTLRLGGSSSNARANTPVDRTASFTQKLPTHRHSASTVRARIPPRLHTVASLPVEIDANGNGSGQGTPFSFGFPQQNGVSGSTPRSESYGENGGQMERLKRQLMDKEAKLSGMQKDVESIAGKSRTLIKALQDKLRISEEQNKAYRSKLVNMEGGKHSSSTILDDIGEREEEAFLSNLEKSDLGRYGGGKGAPAAMESKDDFQFPTVS